MTTYNQASRTSNINYSQASKTSNIKEVQPIILEEGGVISHEELEQKNIARSFSRSSSSSNNSLGNLLFVRFWIITLSLYFLIVPVLCLYVGISYHYCEDINSIWLIVGGILLYIQVFLFLVFMCSSRGTCVACCSISDVDGQLHFQRDSFNGCCCVFFTSSLCVIVWFFFGFGRFFAPARYPSSSLQTGKLEGIYDEFMEDEDCKFYLLTFPFWLTLSPWILLGAFFVTLCFAGLLLCIVPSCNCCP